MGKSFSEKLKEQVERLEECWNKVLEATDQIDEDCIDLDIEDMPGILRELKWLAEDIEAKLLKPWHVELLEKAKVERVYFAYDTPDDLPPLIEISKMLQKSPWYRWRKCGCYVLIGYPNDTIDKAKERLETALKLGYSPFAMFYLDPDGKQHKSKAWAQLQRSWTRPAAINATRKKLFKEASQ